MTKTPCITDYDGKNVTFWYQRHEDNKKVSVTLSAFDFIKSLIIHISERIKISYSF